MTVASNATKFAIQSQPGWRGLIKPYLFSTVAIGASGTIGDFICQYLEKKKKSKDNDRSLTPSSSFFPWWDRHRSLIMCTSAVFVITPWSFTVTRIVERLFPGKQRIQIAKKVLVNSLIAPVGIVLIFTSVILLKGLPLHEAEIKIKKDMPKTFVPGTCYWGFVSFLNFRFIPLDYRPFIGSLAGAIWNIYISSIANKTTGSSNDTLRPLNKTTTTSIPLTSGTTSPTLRQTRISLDQNKKEL